MAGIVAAVAGFVLFSPDLFAHWPMLLAIAKYIMAGGVAALGISARDARDADR